MAQQWDVVIVGAGTTGMVAAIFASRRGARVLLLESAADAYGPALAAIVLTGANHDGAAGLKAVCAAGGTAIVQDFADAQVATMPEAALTACPSARVMTLDDLIPYLLTLAAT